ncbi:type IV secretion system lipoprotein VirB7 [Sphingobium yanoikuyae]|uniref:type IV secretion system lipoprotein VirB7 n=1 Tax=Sphingobium yanoikuyae TaxID=13690 RepID=UPI0004E3C2ED|nr:type IV secretion system lipoprotein VirB7 [Sphingobium yanoikuyae]KFD27419.1 hypothetical protein IH86_14915 [Sphingobium yanoikuyae]MDV3480058.1 type IV secretion system lipoprotein VirB7 [Sphingobium yanoikuyae]
MNRPAFIVLVALTLSACAHHPPLAEAKGPYRPLNAGKWTPTRDDLRGPRAPLPPASSPSLTPEAGS